MRKFQLNNVSEKSLYGIFLSPFHILGSAIITSNDDCRLNKLFSIVY